ncbi:MAG: hypothetical protein ACHQFW_06065 [Chitinophagales bacterium]
MPTQINRRKAATKPEKSTVSAGTLKVYDKLIAGLKSIERKGSAMPYMSMNGHMFSFLNSDGNLSLRLPDSERELFIKKFKTGLTVAHGAIMKEYVDVPDSLFNKTKELQKYFDISYTYVASLNPKVTKKATRKK